MNGVNGRTDVPGGPQPTVTRCDEQNYTPKTRAIAASVSTKV